MHLSNPFKTLLSGLVVLAAMCVGISFLPTQSRSNPAAEAKSQTCPNDDSGLKLPAGFCATVFADEIGHVRHMVVAPSGVLYVNTWSGKYYGDDTPHEGGFLVALQDKSGTGKADVLERFGETVQSGGAGGTGIGMYKGSIYGSCVIRCSPAPPCRVALPRPSSPDCLWAAIIPCIHSSSMPKDWCTSMSPPRPIPAS
jgi:hypothetical protein